VEQTRDSTLRRFLNSLRQVLSATNSLEAGLYPALRIPVRFRPYAPTDFETCVDIYQKNEPGRFPPNQLPEFEAALRQDAKTLIVAEIDSKVVGFGGVTFFEPNSAILYYGIVDPAFQGRQIGTTLTLLRIAQFPAHSLYVVVMIFAVDASMPFYQRFGFSEIGRWKSKDGGNHPVGVLKVDNATIRHIQAKLERRGVRVDGNLVLSHAVNKAFEVRESLDGAVTVKFRRPEKDTDAPGIEDKTHRPAQPADAPNS
jgi:ribosomal-protein-alanine N-acetyltransferase